jgi:hypothetical protein
MGDAFEFLHTRERLTRSTAVHLDNIVRACGGVGYVGPVGDESEWNGWAVGEGLDEVGRRALEVKVAREVYVSGLKRYL